MPNAFVNTIVNGGIEFAASAVKNFASSIIDTGMQFESSMSEVAAISGATGLIWSY